MNFFNSFHEMASKMTNKICVELPLTQALSPSSILKQLMQGSDPRGTRETLPGPETYNSFNKHKNTSLIPFYLPAHLYQTV